MLKTYPDMGEEYLLAIKMAKAKLRAHIVKKNCAPFILQIVWKSVGFFEAIYRDMGIQFETFDAEAEGMRNALSILEHIKEQYPIISNADLYQLAGVVAVEVTGGPEIPFHPGRQVSVGRQDSPKSTLSDAELVALVGYFMGNWSKQIGSDGSEATWTADTHIFDNSYYKTLLAQEVEGSFMNPIHAILMRAPYRRWVEKFASDEVAFSSEYEAAHLKLSELEYSTDHGLFSGCTIS
ncbi:hypothetical protein PTKIN_Ptkin05aG0041400 [Pterospermum kingtungense]